MNLGVHAAKISLSYSLQNKRKEYLNQRDTFFEHLLPHKDSETPYKVALVSLILISSHDRHVHIINDRKLKSKNID